MIGGVPFLVVFSISLPRECQREPIVFIVRFSVEHKVRIRPSEVGPLPLEWAYFTYLARLFESIDARLGYDCNFDLTSITSMFKHVFDGYNETFPASVLYLVCP